MQHTSLWTCTHIPNIIDLSRKKQIFDLEVKGQVPTKFIIVCYTPPYGHAPTHQISLTYLERNNYLTLRSESNKGHYGMRQTALWSCIHIPNIIDLSRKKKKCYAPDKKILFKKQLFDLEVKVHGTIMVIMVHDKPPYGHAPTYQISLTYLERPKSYGPEKLR